MPLVSVDAKFIAQRELEAKHKAGFAAAEAEKAGKKPVEPVVAEPVKDAPKLSD